MADRLAPVAPLVDHQPVPAVGKTKFPGGLKTKTGVVLGTLALRTRSIWAGFLIHVSVAISMDVAAILQNHGIPWR